MPCYIVIRLSFIEKHLASGTNPDVFISGSSSPEGAAELHEEQNTLSFSTRVLYDAYDIYDLSKYYDDTETRPVDGEIMETLIQGAAYTWLYLYFKNVMKRNRLKQA